ncbi:SGNH hydrolase domain-containing protein [Aeromicrobium sp. HA]|uniref:SGNH hydrolase domain-containing protein n=1 Tax=unclassified Aeromicrobium TaxID=2633570 RepID=UPI0022B0694E|nr:SGNH hydrolase domain-containing protein [Aeromicrobium sp. HA]
MTGGRLTTAWCTIAAAAAALFVLGVYWPGRLPGADVAVEVLLVVAGALFAQVLLVERDRPLANVIGTGLRLLVSPLLVLVATGLAVQRWMDVRDWAPLLHDVRDAALALTNVRTVAADSPVATFWLVSLLVQSAVVVLVLRLVADRLASGLSLIVLVLSAASFVWWAFDPALHLGARFWPVGLGVLVALALSRAGDAALGRPMALIAWGTGLGVGAVAVLVSGDLLLTVVGAMAGVLLAASGPAHGSPATWLGPRLSGWLAAIAWAGLCWAGPALRFAPEIAGREIGLRDRAELLLLVGLAAVVTVALVAGLRALVDHGGLWVTVAAAAVLAAFLVTVPGTDRVEAIESDVSRVEALMTADEPDCFGAMTMAALTDGESCANPDLDGVIRPDVSRAGRDFVAYLECWSDPGDANLNICDLAPGAKPAEDAPKILVLGDSHARVLFGAFRRLAEQGVVSVDAAAKASCGWSTLPVVDRKDTQRGPLCDEWRGKLADWLDEHATDYDVVVTTSYNGRMKGPKGRQVASHVEAWEPVTRAGVPIVALRDNPRMPDDTVDCLAALGSTDWSQCDVPLDDVVPEFDPFGPAAEQVDGAHFVDTEPLFCHDDVCPAVIGGVNVYRDYNHVSASYAATLAPVLYREIARTGVFEPPRSPAQPAAAMSH